ncbi:MAG: addiction module protein [Pirellulaceae bacterium]
MTDEQFPDPSSHGAFQYTCRVFEYFASHGEVAVLEALKVELESQIEFANQELEKPIEVSPQMQKIFEERLEEFRRNPQQGISWEELRQKLVAKDRPTET